MKRGIAIAWISLLGLVAIAMIVALIVNIPLDAWIFIGVWVVLWALIRFTWWCLEQI